MEAITSQIRLPRVHGIPINIYTARGIILAHIQHMAPELLTTVASDGSTFRCSNTYVCKFLKAQLNYVPRAATRAAQKVPANTNELMRCSFFCIAHMTRKKKMTHGAFRVKMDQTQVVVQNTGSSTFAEQG